MSQLLIKTDYIHYRQCAKDAWFRIHESELYFSKELSEFAKALIETGNEVELEARKLFSHGVLIEGRGDDAQALTLEYIKKKTPIIFQAVFSKDGFLAATDVLQWDNDSNAWILSEVKASNTRKDKEHLPDLAFQANLLKKCGLDISGVRLIHLSSDYIRTGVLDLNQLFVIEDVTQKVSDMLEDVSKDMDQALEYLVVTDEPSGSCSCIYQGRSKHCTMFAHINPDIPEYSVHDISRIGSSKKKLKELVDSGVTAIENIAVGFNLTDIQNNQVTSHKTGEAIIDIASIQSELEDLVFPLNFLDYETFPCAIPRFDGFSPYQQIPFQYSLHVLETPESDLTHKEYLYIGSDDPSPDFLDSLKHNISTTGSIIVWSKRFERGINDELATRIPSEKPFMDSMNGRIYDLMDIFSKQLHVHPEFRGKTSLKTILPALVPELTYDDLEIQEGGTASQEWNKIATEQGTSEERAQIAKNLRKYCAMDTFAMYAIWKHLFELSVS